MNHQSLSFTQKIFRFFMPAAMFEQARLDSNRWYVRCDCGAETTVWEMGGLRYKAAGKPLILSQCKACGKKKMRQLEYRAVPGK